MVEVVKKNTNPLPEFYSSLVKGFHSLLFVNILSNAGHFRQIDEPNRGFVGFGGPDTRSTSAAKFRGTPASEIEIEVGKAVAVLSGDAVTPLENSILFYQKFVRIHPFYDANGRIARLVVSIYLGSHGHRVLWKDLETTKKNQFLKKLNSWHKREGTPSFEEYLSRLTVFWKQFVISESQLR